jgi:proton-translocating NADH-quinone oxidoreductase chain M
MLSTIILLPLVGIFFLTFISNSHYVKITALIISLLNFIFSLGLWVFFDNATANFQFVETYCWFETIYITLGIDGISLFFILLTTLLVPICLLVGWTSIKSHIKLYFVIFLAMESLMIGVFTILDIFLFYIFFESILIPMFLIVGVWGSRERKIRAAYQFFLYTLIGSVLMLQAILFFYYQAGSTDLQILLTTKLSERRQILLWFAFFCSFAVKVPMIPFHLWLPEAHCEAPTAGSVILAGILLKLGTYGFLRWSIPLFPTASIYFAPLVYTISVIGIIYASLTTLRQIDLKKIIAYSSVAHMGICTLGLFSLNIQGIEGAILLMLSHGFVASALFLCVGSLYDRTKTRLIKYYGGLVHTMPIFSIIFFIFTLGNLGLPCTSSFCGEILVLIGAFQINTFITILSCSGMIIGAAYSLWLYNRIIFGNLTTFYTTEFTDLNRREIFIFFPFVIGIFMMGIFPDIFLQSMHPSVNSILQ